MEKEDKYQNQVRELASHLTEYIKENNAVDIYEEYFAGSVVDHTSEPASAKTLTVFRYG